MRYSRPHESETRPGEVYVVVYGKPLPPPARGTHWLSLDAAQAPSERAPFETCGDYPGYRWSEGLA